eukprot:scaffold943_cov159-Skeletonema_menzelii.AAC.5
MAIELISSDRALHLRSPVSDDQKSSPTLRSGSHQLHQKSISTEEFFPSNRYWSCRPIKKKTSPPVVGVIKKNIVSSEHGKMRYHYLL